MVRLLLAALLGLTLTFGAVADDKKTGDKNTGDKAGHKGKEATITKVDQKNGTITVKMKGKDGKETEKTFKLAETVRYVDSAGNVAAADVFKSGDYVLVVEAEGKVKEVRQAKPGGSGSSGGSPNKPNK